jgi:hypothetical protein
MERTRCSLVMKSVDALTTTARADAVTRNQSLK